MEGFMQELCLLDPGTEIMVSMSTNFTLLNPGWWCNKIDFVWKCSAFKIPPTLLQARE